jgi:hypothetical protein
MTAGPAPAPASLSTLLFRVIAGRLIFYGAHVAEHRMLSPGLRVYPGLSDLIVT